MFISVCAYKCNGSLLPAAIKAVTIVKYVKLTRLRCSS